VALLENENLDNLMMEAYIMKIKILLMVILLLSICSIIYGKCILKHKEVESYLAVLEGPKELV